MRAVENNRVTDWLTGFPAHRQTALPVNGGGVTNAGLNCGVIVAAALREWL